MRNFLLDSLNSITYPVSCIVFYEKMDMVFVSLHSNDFAFFRFTYIKNLLFNIVSSVTFEQLFSVLRYLYDMYFQTVFTPVVTIISVVHSLLP